MDCYEQVEVHQLQLWMKSDAAKDNKLNPNQIDEIQQFRFNRAAKPIDDTIEMLSRLMARLRSSVQP